MTVLIDTDVVLDYMLRREPFADAVFNCIDYLTVNKSNIWLTASTVTDIYYVSNRTLKKASAAKKIVATLLHSYQVAAVSKTDCINALCSQCVDYEDALTSICAERVKAKYIITRNLKGFNESSIPAISPEAYLSKYATPKD